MAMGYEQPGVELEQKPMNGLAPGCWGYMGGHGTSFATPYQKQDRSLWEASIQWSAAPDGNFTNYAAWKHTAVMSQLPA